MIVLLAGFGALAVLGAGAALTIRRAAAAAAVAAGSAIVLVLLDRASGGASHVTSATERGPSGLTDDLTRRLDISWAGATQSWHTVLLCSAGLAGLALLATRSPRHPPVDAFLVAFAVSLVVNDSPVDELVWGSLGCTALWAWCRAGRTSRYSSSPAALRAWRRASQPPPRSSS